MQTTIKHIQTCKSCIFLVQVCFFLLMSVPLRAQESRADSSAVHLRDVAAQSPVILSRVLYDSPFNEAIQNPPYSNGEFIEIYNQSPHTVNLSGFRLTGGITAETYTFNSVILAPYSFLVLAYRHVSSSFDLSQYYQGLDNHAQHVIHHHKIVLSNQGESLTLYNAQGQVCDSMHYEGTSNPYMQGRLEAKNPLNMPYMQCKCLARKHVTTDAQGRILFLRSDWTAQLITAPALQDQYNEHNPDLLTQNYITVVTPLEETDSIGIMHGHLQTGCGRMLVTTQYYDERGKLTQTIQKGASPSCDDIVTKYEYDSSGQLSREWLPRPASQENFYNDSKPYTTTSYSEPALHRVGSTTQPGQSYSNHPQVWWHYANTDDEVVKWKVSAGGLERCGTYKAGSLKKTTHKDEDNRTAVRYTNLKGQEVLLRRAGDNDTYYVYDDCGRLRYILPPAVCSRLTADGLSDDDCETLRLYATVYRYDPHGNLVYKRLPGCAPVLYRYDEHNRLCASQDGNQRAQGKRWTVTDYDSIGRVTGTSEIDSLHPAYNRVLVRNFYDDYTFLQSVSSEVAGVLSFSPRSGVCLSHATAVGRLTGTRVCTLTGDTATWTAFYYDRHGRIIQQCCTTAVGGEQRQSSRWNFDGTVAVKRTETDETTEQYRFTYDHQGRLRTTKYLIDQQDTVMLSEKQYDEVGRLVANKRHNAANNETFRYDMRGNLTRHITSWGETELLYYADSLPAGVTACYNGNLSATAVQLVDTAIFFQYSYDALNRLTEAYGGEGSMTGELFAYDNMGNLQTLTRYRNGDNPDELEYTYHGNRLVHLQDHGSNLDMYGIYEYTGPYYGAADSCRYDANGNLTYDAGRGITRISYNLMNLPDTVFFVNGNVIVNLYDAAGVRHKTTYITSPPPAVSVPGRMLEAWEDEEVTTEEVLYIGHIIRTIVPATEPNQVATVQCRINNAEGYVLKCMPDVPVQYGNTNSQYGFFYETRDHLGNIISVWDAGHQWLTQQTTYWPSGMPFTWRGEQHVTEQLMNGHEYIPMHGYDMYDFGFRHYYATIGRFTSPDPMSEQAPWQSPYCYASNNFTGEIDWMGLFGMSPIEINDRRQCIIINGEGTMIGGIDDGDSNIYVDVDGDWCISDGKEGLQCVGIMIAPFNYYYDRFIKFHGSWKAIGLYYNNIRLYGNVAIGINVSTMLKNFFYLGINIISFDLLNVTLTLDDDFDDDIDNYNIYYFAKNKECIISQGIGLALLSIEHSFKVRGGVGKEKDIRYISGTESYKIESVIHKNENDLYLNLLSIDDKGNWKISFGCSAIFQFNVSVQGNLYYQK